MGIKRNARLVEIDRKARIARKRSDQLYAKTGANTRERAASYFMRRNRLTRVQKRLASFIEGIWTPKGHTKQDEMKRLQLRPYVKVLLEAPRFQGSKKEGERQATLRHFLNRLTSKA